MLSGPQNILTAEQVTESLAGRVAILDPFQLSRRESEGRPQCSLPWEPASREEGRHSYSFRRLWNSHPGSERLRIIACAPVRRLLRSGGTIPFAPSSRLTRGTGAMEARILSTAGTRSIALPLNVARAPARTEYRLGPRRPHEPGREGLAARTPHFVLK